MADDDLLRPSLSGIGKSPSLYGSTGFFLVSFFAGPAAAGVYGLANSFRLGRLRQDVPVIVAVVATCFLLLLLLHRHGGLAAVGSLLGTEPKRSFQLVVRALGLGTFAAIYLLHRQNYRAAQVSGVEPLSGWAPGTAAVAAGFALNLAIATLVFGHH